MLIVTLSDTGGIRARAKGERGTVATARICDANCCARRIADSRLTCCLLHPT